MGKVCKWYCKQIALEGVLDSFDWIMCRAPKYHCGQKDSGVQKLLQAIVLGSRCKYFANTDAFVNIWHGQIKFRHLKETNTTRKSVHELLRMATVHLNDSD